jgi:hypothetical protein
MVSIGESTSTRAGPLEGVKMLRAWYLKGWLGLGLLLASPAVTRADFHFFFINEVFTNPEGTIQFVELFTSFGAQNNLGGHTIRASNGPNINVFTFGSGLVGDTTNKHVLIATPGFAAIPGAVTPDYTFPSLNFLFQNGAVNFAEGTDILNYISPPWNGITSLNGNGVPVTNSPTNFAGQSGFIPEPTLLPVLAPGGLLLRRRR